MIETYSQSHSINTIIVERPSYNLMPRGLNDQSFFIIGIKSWKVLFLFLKLKSFIFVLLMEVLKSFILALLLDSYMQVVKS